MLLLRQLRRLVVTVVRARAVAAVHYEDTFVEGLVHSPEDAAAEEAASRVNISKTQAIFSYIHTFTSFMPLDVSIDDVLPAEHVTPEHDAVAEVVARLSQVIPKPLILLQSFIHSRLRRLPVEPKLCF